MKFSFNGLCSNEKKNKNIFWTTNTIMYVFELIHTRKYRKIALTRDNSYKIYMSRSSVFFVFFFFLRKFLVSTVENIMNEF